VLTRPVGYVIRREELTIDAGLRKAQYKKDHSNDDDNSYDGLDDPNRRGDLGSLGKNGSAAQNAAPISMDDRLRLVRSACVGLSCIPSTM